MCVCVCVCVCGVGRQDKMCSLPMLSGSYRVHRAGSHHTRQQHPLRLHVTVLQGINQGRVRTEQGRPGMVMSTHTAMAAGTTTRT